MSGRGPARVLVVVENLPLARDHRLRKQAQALARAGFAVSVICRRDPGNRCIEGVRVYGYPPPPEGGSKAAFALEYAWSWLMAAVLVGWVAVTTGFDVLQVCGAPDIYAPLMRLARWRGKRVVYDQRDPSPETYTARYGSGSPVVRRALLALERATCRAADRVLTVNAALRDTVVRRDGVAPGAVSVVGNGPLLAAVRAARERPELRRGRPHLCCWVGVIGPQDRLDLALRAVAHLVHDHGRDDCAVAVIGDGDARSACERLAADLDVQRFVTFTGWLAQSEVFDYLASADVGLESNLEPFVSPVKVMEYMAFGLPVAAFDLPETRAVAGAAAGYAPGGDVTELAHRVVEALDPSVGAARGEAGRRRVEAVLAWERQEQVYLQVVRDLLMRTGERPASREVAA